MCLLSSATVRVSLFSVGVRRRSRRAPQAAGDPTGVCRPGVGLPLHRYYRRRRHRQPCCIRHPSPTHLDHTEQLYIAVPFVYVDEQVKHTNINYVYPPAIFFDVVSSHLILECRRNFVGLRCGLQAKMIDLWN